MMPDKTPKVSIVMPAYNSANTIERSVNSVLNQTFADWELLIMDDCSTDDTLNIAHKYHKTDSRILCFTGKKNEGVSAVRNCGVSLCKGEYIAFLDSDDIWAPEKLEKQLGLITKNGADICYTSYAIVNNNGDKVRPDYIVPSKVDFDALLMENVIGCSTVLLSADKAKQTPFKKEFYHEDYVLWLELLKQGCRAVGCAEPLTYWCYQESSRSYNKLRSMYNRWLIYRKALHLSLGKSMFCLAHYAFAGIRKYKK